MLKERLRMLKAAERQMILPRSTWNYSCHADCFSDTGIAPVQALRLEVSSNLCFPAVTCKQEAKLAANQEMQPIPSPMH